MKVLMSALALSAALGATGCEGMAPGGYGDPDLDPNISGAGSAIPQLPPQPGIPPPPSMPRPPSTSFPTSSGPATPSMPRPPPTTGGPSQMPKPPTAPPPASSPPPGPASACSAPNIVIRTEITGAVEIKCGQPPIAPPASLKCTAPEHLTWLTRNGVSNFQCMR